MTEFKAGELAYVRIQLPDLDEAHRFLTDFGLIEVERTPQALYFRGTDATPYCYEVQKGPAHFLGFGFEVADPAQLDAAAKAFAATVEPVGGPGGGRRVRLCEPNGYAVDLVHGRAAAEPIPLARQMMNTGAQPLLRKGELYRLSRDGVVPVKRLAHVVLGTPKVTETVAWFRQTLGMLISDEIVAGPQEELTGAFMRLDAGEAFVDHHTLFAIRAKISGLHHISFEAHDVDAVMAEHHRLKALGRYEHAWGVGRHLLGSQIFDYWLDPFGYLHEHWADSDRLDAAAPAGRWEIHEGMRTQWGEEPSARVREAVRP